MKISELILKMQETMETEGDLEVMCWPYDGQDRDYPLEQVEVVRGEEGSIVVVDA